MSEDITGNLRQPIHLQAAVVCAQLYSIEEGYQGVVLKAPDGRTQWDFNARLRMYSPNVVQIH